MLFSFDFVRFACRSTTISQWMFHLRHISQMLTHTHIHEQFSVRTYCFAYFSRCDWQPQIAVCGYIVESVIDQTLSLYIDGNLDDFAFSFFVWDTIFLSFSLHRISPASSSPPTPPPSSSSSCSLCARFRLCIFSLAPSCVCSRWHVMRFCYLVEVMLAPHWLYPFCFLAARRQSFPYVYV